MSVIVIALPTEPWTTVCRSRCCFRSCCGSRLAAGRCSRRRRRSSSPSAIVWTTTIGIGHFGDPSLPMTDRVLAARAGILAVAVCAYVLAALFAERRQHEAVLAESEARLQEALTAGAVTTFVWDVDTGSPQRSVNAAQILGFDPRQAFTANNFLSRVHPEDRERFKALVRGVHPERPAYIRHIPVQAPRRPGNLARGNGKCRIRRRGGPCTPQGPDSRRHRAQAVVGPAKTAHRRTRSSR